MRTREQKQQHIDSLVSQFHQSRNIFLVSFEGLTVAKDWELRGKLRELDNSVTYQVVKNRLAQKAVEGTPLDQLRNQFKGMTAVAVSQEDPVSVAKVLTDFARENQALRLKAGVVDGQLVGPAQIEAIAKLPGKSQIIAQIMGMINIQAQHVVSVVNGVARNLVVVLGQIRDQKADAAGADS